MSIRLQSVLVFSLGLLSVIVLAAYLYSFGLGAGLQFDDAANLSGLKKINDGQPFWHFVFGGNAGPLGRPISLLTFALQSHSWPLVPRDFIYLNVAIHLINGCLIMWLVWLLTSPKAEKTSIYQALVVGAIWLLMPLLASSSLMIVQRMATLTATVVLAGLIAYVKVRYRLDKNPNSSMVWLTVILVLFTVLAGLVKENGVLFPVYCLAVEILLMCYAPVHGTVKTWKIWKIVFFGIPLLVTVAYLVAQLDYSQATVIRRGFDGVDRLLSQAQTLFQYLFRAFLPRPSVLGPFHDHLIIEPNTAFYASTLLASLVWVALLAIAFKFRKRYPELLFALTWFLGGHLLESTSIAIELYFEHRNYIPIIGPIIALIIFSFRFFNQERKALYVGVAVLYITLSGIGLLGQTTLWGDRLLAANIWTMSNPKSVRAVVHLTKVMREHGEGAQVPRVYANYLEVDNDPRIKFYRLVALCKLKFDISKDDISINYETIEGKTAFAINMSSIYQELFQVQQESKCAGLSEQDVYSLGEQLLRVPEVRVSNIAVHNIYSILAVQSLIAGDLKKSKENVQAALKADFYLDTFEVALKIADHSGDVMMKNDLWGRVYSHRPRHPVKRQIWDQWIDKIKEEHPNDSESRI